jgi:hypothetical protein
VQLDVVTLFPDWFDWFAASATSQRADAGHELRTLNPRDHTTLSGKVVDDTPFGGGAGMVLRVDVMDQALQAFYGVDPVELRTQRRVIALTPGGRQLDDAWVDELAGRRRHVPVRTLRGLRRADRPALLLGRDVDRALRAQRRRAGGDGRLRRGAAQAARVARATRSPRSRSRSPSRWRAIPSTRTTRGPPSTAGGAFPTSC